MQSSQHFQSQKKSRTRENIIAALKNSIIASDRLKYFKKKPEKSYLRTPKKLLYCEKHLNFSNPSSPNLYSSPDPKKASAYSFSNLSRFENNIFEKFKSK